jgi:hypothetical protein
MQQPVVEPRYRAELRLAELRGVCDDRVEHRLDIGGRARDHGQDLARGTLPGQGLVALGCPRVELLAELGYGLAEIDLGVVGHRLVAGLPALHATIPFPPLLCQRNARPDHVQIECQQLASAAVSPRPSMRIVVRTPDLHHDSCLGDVAISLARRDWAVTCAPLAAGQAMLLDPVLLIGIPSPANQANTWTNVHAYTSIASAREILILRADCIAAELLRRSPQGEWPVRPIVLTEGDLVLESIDFRVALADLYTRTGLQTPLGSTGKSTPTPISGPQFPDPNSRRPQFRDANSANFGDSHRGRFKSLIAGFASLFGRISSLFGHLGNLTWPLPQYQRLGRRGSVRKGPGMGVFAVLSRRPGKGLAPKRGSPPLARARRAAGRADGRRRDGPGGPCASAAPLARSG